MADSKRITDRASIRIVGVAAEQITGSRRIADDEVYKEECVHYDLFTGTSAALIAVGLVTPDMLPNIAGVRRGRRKFPYLEISQYTDRLLRVEVALSPEEHEKRQAEEHARTTRVSAEIALREMRERELSTGPEPDPGEWDAHLASCSFEAQFLEGERCLWWYAHETPGVESPGEGTIVGGLEYRRIKSFEGRYSNRYGCFEYVWGYRVKTHHDGKEFFFHPWQLRQMDFGVRHIRLAHSNKSVSRP